MLSASEGRYVLERAYVPEQLVHYFTAISRAEPFLLEDCVCYAGEGHVSLIAYPLSSDLSKFRPGEVLERAVERFKPAQAAVISPSRIEVEPLAVLERGSDHYYLLELEKLRLRKKLRSGIRSAGRRLEVEEGEFGEEHRALVEEFLERGVGERTSQLFLRLPDYASRDEPLLLEARRRGTLVAFSIFDFSSRFAFYMFNFISRRRYVPGASDLLLYQGVQRALEEGKKLMNLGLGISRGVARFKEKWGARRWLGHEFLVYDCELASVAESYRRMGI
ncbi:MAG: GNAT family N-acetyltransferase [Euryarchaeota archaeon]|nr:GNAT family N-acetyltransferase [Euryarchaeota archaeon]